MQIKLAANHRVAQILFQLGAFFGCGVEIFGKEPEHAASRVLGGIERQIDIADQFFAGRTMLGRERNPDRCADHHTLPLNRIGLRQRSDDLARDMAKRGAILLAGHDDLEFIPTQTAAPARAVNHPFEPLRHLFQQGIARRMAERVVDLFEAVEIKHQHGASPFTRARRGKDLFEHLAHLHPVCEPGQRIKMGQSRNLLFTAALFRKVGAVPAKAAEILVGIIYRPPRQRPPAFFAIGRSAQFDITESGTRRQVKGKRARGIICPRTGMENLAQRKPAQRVGILSQSQRCLGRNIGNQTAPVDFPEPALPRFLETAQDILGPRGDTLTRLTHQPIPLGNCPLEPRYQRQSDCRTGQGSKCQSAGGNDSKPRPTGNLGKKQ